MGERVSPGWSLVEVLAALAMLAGTLLAVVGAFTAGARGIDAGGKRSEALSVARGMLEETAGWGFERLWTEFGFDGGAPAYLVDSRTHPRAAPWQARLDAMLAGARAEIELRSLEFSGAPPPPLFSARAIRVTVRVHWIEGARRRWVGVCSVRF